MISHVVSQDTGQTDNDTHSNAGWHPRITVLHPCCCGSLPTFSDAHVRLTYSLCTPQMPNAAASISRAVEVAHRAGTLVVLTAGDAGLVQRKRPQLLEALRQGADILFTNRCARAGPLSCCSRIYHLF